MTPAARLMAKEDPHDPEACLDTVAESRNGDERWQEHATDADRFPAWCRDDWEGEPLQAPRPEGFRDWFIVFAVVAFGIGLALGTGATWWRAIP